MNIQFEAVPVEQELPPVCQIVHVLLGGHLPQLLQLRPDGWYTLGMAEGQKVEKGVTHWLRRCNITSADEPKPIMPKDVAPISPMLLSQLSEIMGQIDLMVMEGMHEDWVEWLSTPIARALNFHGVNLNDNYL